MAQQIIQILQSLFRYPLYVFETIISNCGMIMVYISGVIGSFFLVKIVQRYTNK